MRSARQGSYLAQFSITRPRNAVVAGKGAVSQDNLIMDQGVDDAWLYEKVILVEPRQVMRRPRSTCC